MAGTANNLKERTQFCATRTRLTLSLTSTYFNRFSPALKRTNPISSASCPSGACPDAPPPARTMPASLPPLYTTTPTSRQNPSESVSTDLKERTQFPGAQTIHKSPYSKALRYIPLAQNGTRRTQFRCPAKRPFGTSLYGKLPVAGGTRGGYTAGRRRKRGEECILVWNHRASEMSWDIFVQNIPEHVKQISDMKRYGDSLPRYIGQRSDIIRTIKEAVPQADFTDPAWGVIDGADFSIEVSMGDKEECKGFVFHVRGSDEAVLLVSAILEKLGLRAFDPGSETGLFEARPDAVKSLQKWRQYRDWVIEGKRPT